MDDDDDFFKDGIIVADIEEPPVEYPLDVVVVVSGDKVPEVDCFNISAIFWACNNDRCCR
jgi:hypothetical protein